MAPRCIARARHPRSRAHATSIAMLGSLVWAASISIACGDDDDARGDAAPGPREECTTSSECAPPTVCVLARCVAPPDADHADGGLPDATTCGAGDDDPTLVRGERCDGRDDDCDGEIDEVARDVCAECSAACVAAAMPAPSGWALSTEGSANVEVTSDGALVLRDPVERGNAMWIANRDESTVSKIDADTGRELARYPSARPTADNGARPLDEPCDAMRTGNCPSATAVDQLFDAYVANRAPGSIGTVSKIASRRDGCVDRDSDGVIETSSDANEDGTIDVDDPSEFVGVDDECLLWTAAVGVMPGSMPQALAIGPATEVSPIGDVWVGTRSDQEMCTLDPLTGAPRTLCVRATGIAPNTAATDRSGRVWVLGLGEGRGTTRRVLAWIDPVSARLTYASEIPMEIPSGSFGLAIDRDEHVWVTGADAGTVLRYDPERDTWEAAGVPTGGTVRGIATDATSAWIADSAANEVWQVDRVSLDLVRRWSVAGTRGVIGAGVTFAGRVWAVGRESSSLARIDPTTDEILEVATGRSPDSFGDFTGLGLNVFASASGRHHFSVEGCAGSTTRWSTLRIDAELPPGTRVEAWARSAFHREELQFEDWIGPFDGSPSDLRAAPGPVPDGLYLQIELRLFTETPGTSPRVMRIDATGTCDP